jgi:hypothetical protein
MEITSNEPIAVHARFAPECRIRVLDADTQRDLEAVQVLADVERDFDGSVVVNTGETASKRIYPTPWMPSDVRQRSISSPFVMTVDVEPEFTIQWKEPLWFHSANHEWLRKEIDFRKGGEHVISLHRAGSIRVLVAGETLPDDARIVIRPGARNRGDGMGGDADPKRVAIVAPFSSQDAEPLLEWWRFNRKSPTLFDGIPFGEYEIALETEHTEKHTVRLASAHIHVASGESPQVRLEALPIPPVPEEVPLLVSVSLSPEWEPSAFDLIFVPRDVSPLKRQKLLRFSSSELVADDAHPGYSKLPSTFVSPGIYDLSIERFGIRREIDLRTSRQPVLVCIGTPTDLVVHFVNAVTRTPVRVNMAAWYDATSAGDTKSDLSGAYSNAVQGVESWSIRVPIGRLGMVVLADGYEPACGTTFPVPELTRELDVALMPRFGVQLVFRVDGGVVHWRDLLGQRDGRQPLKNVSLSSFGIQRQDSSGEWRDDETAVQGQDDGDRVFVRSPGTYRIVFPIVPGFAQIPPTVIPIGNREVTLASIDLVRSSGAN